MLFVSHIPALSAKLGDFQGSGAILIQVGLGMGYEAKLLVLAVHQVYERSGLFGSVLVHVGAVLFQRIAALEQENKAELISSPRIMTLDNEEALIEQGTDIPYPKLSEEGTTETEFKKATLSLKVTPHITADKSIMMEIDVQKDQASAARFALDTPGIDSRSAATKVLVCEFY